MDAEDGKSVSDCWQTGYSWNDAGTQAAFVYNGSIQIIDLSGKPVGSIPITEPVISLRYLPGGEDLLAVFQNGLLCRYHVQDTVCCASINLADHCTGFYTVSADRWQWVFPDENTLLAVTDYGGFLIDTAQDSLKMKAQINQCMGYHAPSDRILVAETYSYSGKNTTIGTFPRYSTGDLIQKAYAVLNP
jgi:hypothetical protein